jgi:hypothetical protein
MEKMLTIPGHKGNGKPHQDSTSPPFEELTSRTPPTTNVVDNVWKRYTHTFLVGMYNH